MIKEDLFGLMKGQVIVSCQAEPGEPLYDRSSSLMAVMARAAKQAGAKIIRTSSTHDIAAIKEETGLPVIGMIRRSYPGYRGCNTMTMREVDECVEAMADVISIDCTDTARGDGLSSVEFVKIVKSKYPNIILMADVARFEEGEEVFNVGADLIGTALAGETPVTAAEKGRPAYELVRKLSSLSCPIIAEGNIREPEEVSKMFEAGAWSVIVGSAITRPQVIAKRFLDRAVSI